MKRSVDKDLKYVILKKRNAIYKEEI